MRSTDCWANQIKSSVDGLFDGGPGTSVTVEAKQLRIAEGDGDEQTLRLKTEADIHGGLPSQRPSTPPSTHFIPYYHADYGSIRGEAAQGGGGEGSFQHPPFCFLKLRLFPR